MPSPQSSFSSPLQERARPSAFLSFGLFEDISAWMAISCCWLSLGLTWARGSCSASGRRTSEAPRNAETEEACRVTGLHLLPRGQGPSSFAGKARTSRRSPDQDWHGNRWVKGYSLWAGVCLRLWGRTSSQKPNHNSQVGYSVARSGRGQGTF